jgi:cell fate (sporulation/competence/biofilm development) regulator YlbF (YheA/YmcA/DUF963 family)
MINIYDSANEVASNLQKTNQFDAVAKAIAAIKADPESLDLFKKMDEIQGKIIKSQQTGQPLSKDLEEEYKDLDDKAKDNELLTNLLLSEQSMYNLISDLQKAITKPVNDLYDDLRN